MSKLPAERKAQKATDPTIDRKQPAQLAPTLIQRGKVMTPSSTSIVPFASAIAGEKSALFRDILRDEGEIPDKDPRYCLATYGLWAEEIEDLKPKPIRIPINIDKTTTRIFRMAQNAGVLAEVFDLWKTVGKPRLGTSPLYRLMFAKCLVTASKRVREERRQTALQEQPRWPYSEPRSNLAFSART